MNLDHLFPAKVKIHFFLYLLQIAERKHSLIFQLSKSIISRQHRIIRGTTCIAVYINASLFIQLTDLFHCMVAGCTKAYYCIFHSLTSHNRERGENVIAATPHRVFPVSDSAYC